MKTIKYLALLGFAGDLLLNSLGVAALVANTQAAGGLYEMEDGPVAYAYETDGYEEAAEYEVEAEGTDEFYGYEAYGEIYYDEEFVEYGPDDIETEEVGGYGEYDSKGYGDEEVEETEYSEDEEVEETEYSEDEEEEFQLVFISREIAEQMSDEEIRELGGDVMETEVETVRPSGRSMVAESATPWRNLPPYNSCPNYNAQGNKIVDGVVVDGVQCVSSGAALNAAWNNNDVHRIIMVDNITLTASTLTTRRTSLEFDGNGRRPDGRPSGMGPNGDGFTLTRPATEATLNLGISMGTTSEETTVATPDDIGYFENGGGSLLHFHSVVIAGQQSSGGGSNTAFNGLINSNIPFENVGTATTPQRRNRTGTWRFRFGNIRMTNLDVTHDVQTGRVTDWAVRPGTDNSLHRFMRAPQSEITFYGDVLLNTRRQNFYAGKILFEDDTLYVGHISYAPSNFYGVFWFNMRMHARTTGSDPSCGRPGYLTLPVERPTAGTGENQTDCRNSVVLGRGARTYFTSGSTATHAPTVFGHWRNIIIGDNASFETSQNAPAIAFENNIANTGGAPSLAGVETINGATQTVRVHHGGRLVASRNNNGQVISNSSPNHNTSSTGSAEASNALIDIRSGATLKVVGSANTTGAGNTGAIINLTGTNNRLQVAKGANVDLRNESDLNTAHIFNRGSGANYIFETPSEIILWTNGADTGGTAQANSRNATYSFSGVGDLRVVGTATEFGSLAEGFQPNLPTLGNPDRFRRLITTPQGTAIQSLEPVNSSDTEIRGTVAWPSIPVSLGTGNGIIGRQREMRSLQSDRHDVLLNDSFNPEWVYTEADDEGNVEQVAGDPVWVRINPDGSFIYSDPYGRNQLQGSYILARMHLRDEGMTTRVLAFEAEDEEARQNLGCLYQDDEDGCYYTYYEDGRHELGFITAERMRMMTDEEIIAEGGGIISNGQPVARLGRLFPAWAEESPHNSCPNINGSGNFVVNLAVLQDANDPASGVICVGNDGIFTYAPGASQTVRNNVATANNNRATGHMQAAWSNNNIRRIIMMSDITLQSGTTGSSTSTVGGNPATVTFPANSHGSATLRNTSLEFDGNGTRPDGRPSGLGAGGDGFVLSQGSGQHSFNLAPYIGSGSTATYVANPTDSVDFANGAGGRVHFHSVVIHGTATMSYGANGPHRGVINSSLGWDGAYDGGSAAVPNRINRTGTWRFRFGNIRTNGFENIERDPITGRITDWDVQTTPANLPSIARLTRGQQAEMTFYGDVLLNTRAENVYTGKMLLEDGALYVGNVNRSTFSIVWFSARMHGQTTAADPSCGNLTLPAERPVAGAGENQTDCRNSLVLGSGARMYLTSTSTGSSYPAVYAHWRNIIVGEDAGFEVSTNNPSIAFSSGISNTGGMASMRGVTQTIRGHLGSRIIATRRSNGVVIHNQTSNINSAGGAAAQNALIDIRPGAQFFVLGAAAGGTGAADGNTTNSIINLVNGSAANPNVLNIEGAATVDIRNEHTANTARILNRGTGAEYRFSNINEFVLWTNGTVGPGGAGVANTTGGSHQMNTRHPSFIVPDVHNLAIRGTGADGIVAPGQPIEGILRDPGLVYNNTGTVATALNTGRFRRLVATSDMPYAHLTDAITDADQTLRGEVVLTHIPISDGFGNASVGNGVRFRPLLAGSGRHRVIIDDSFGHHRLVPNPDGTFAHTTEGLQVAGTVIGARAIRLEPDGSDNYTQTDPTQATVLDVTPPTPATIDFQVSTQTTFLSGTAPADAKGAILELTRGETVLTFYPVIENGTWRVDFDPGTLQEGDSLQVLLYDEATALTASDFAFERVVQNPALGIPATHIGSPRGNLNPRNAALSYRDATGELAFLPGPITIVQAAIFPRDPEAPGEDVVPVMPNPEYPGELMPVPALPPGALRIDFASAFRFENVAIGSVKISQPALPQPILRGGELAETDLWVQVTDQRISGTPWNLQVEMETPFANGEHVLTAAEVLIREGRHHRANPEFIRDIPNLIRLGQGEGWQQVMSASGEDRAGTHLAIFDPKEVTFNLPNNTVVRQGDYVATFRWLLADTVPNVN